MLYFMTRMGTAKMVTNGFEKLIGRKPRTLYSTWIPTGEINFHVPQKFGELVFE